jgi:hypothetical protein
MRLGDSSLMLKVYRTRVVRTLFEAMPIRIPRLARKESRFSVPVLLAGHKH